MENRQHQHDASFCQIFWILFSVIKFKFKGNYG
jgi:hypothetical protein